MSVRHPPFHQLFNVLLGRWGHGERWAEAPEEETGRVPEIVRQWSAGGEVAIAFKYYSFEFKAMKQTFRKLLRRSNHNVSECCVNTLFDNFHQKLSRPDKTKYLITRCQGGPMKIARKD